MSSKEILREEIKAQLKTVSACEFSSQGGRAAAILKMSPIWASYKTIFIFLSMNSEIETRAFLETALADGKKAFAPRIEKDDLVFYRILSTSCPWQKGPFGTKEPPGERPAEHKDFPALILAPGLAFDRKGRRLGRGRGYYDRFFAELDREGKQYYAIGLCMDFQLIDEVPAVEYDKKVTGILTCKGLQTIT